MQAIILSYHHLSSGQVETCIRSTPVGAGLHSPAMLLFNRPIRGILPKMNRGPININNDGTQYKALKSCQDKYVNGNDICKDSLSFPIGSTVSLQCEDGEPWMNGVIEEPNNSDHRWRSSIIKSDKDGQIDNVEHKA